MDNEIIQLFEQRSEQALTETQNQYGQYAKAIAYNILKNTEDVNECVNDMLLKLWSSIPPSKPISLKAYIGTIIRNTSLDYYRKSKAKKRHIPNTFDHVLKELDECIESQRHYIEHENNQVISVTISNFLKQISDEKRLIFINRYYYAEPIKNISKKLNVSQSKVKTTLFRIRKDLKIYLREAGIYL